MAGERILAVDEEPEVTLQLHRVLSRAGFIVQATGRGEEAIALLEKEPFALLMVGKNLPGMSGFEVISRARGQLPGLAVVMITAYPEPFTAAQERLDGYLTKPFKDLSALAELARSALENRAMATAKENLTGRLGRVVAEFAPVGRKPR